MASSNKWVWVDLEMSGLEVDRCAILEIATLITDADLQIVARGPEIVIHQPDEVLEAMDEWNTNHHGASGLTEAVRQSSVSVEEAEERTLEFVRQHCEEGRAPLCGNSVWQDRRFLAKYMPNLEEYLHYRIIDVSSLKEMVRHWYDRDIKAPPKAGSHRALEDIQESIRELEFYRKTVFRTASRAKQAASEDDECDAEESAP